MLEWEGKRILCYEYYNYKMKVNNFDWIIEPVEGKSGLAIANIRYFDEPNLEKDQVQAVISVFGEK